ncbi:hypothetical protein TeGR_g12122 [Tetraparma gracilis]|uniref:Uncharacterized protein n=1 Tax=Tetraparma gracilis TaxID=2962635 RepID=A0ABQ6M8B1_9STRA|nr:hypothetical protein TeGR_g12122 [Tetraparma gracilis]
MYVSFFVASLASIFASTVIHHTLRPPLAISTILLASYVGGAVNMLALARMLEVPSATTSMYCAVDCGVMLIYLALVEWLHATLLLARAIGSAFNAVAPAAVPRTVTAQSTVLSLVALGSYFKDRVPAKRKKELVVFSQLTSQLFYSAVALSLGASRSDLRAFPYLVVGGLQLLHVLVMFFAVLAKRSWATQLLLASNAAIGGAGTAALFAANVQKPELVEDGSYLVGGFTAVAWASFLQ